MNAVLLQKIEELTLYTIQQQKEIKTLKQENSNLTEKLDGLKSIEDRLNAIEDMIKKN
jgi:cell division protein FtsB